MQYIGGLIFLLAGLSAVAACGTASEPELPDASAEAVMEYLEKVDYQENWELWPELGEKVLGQRAPRDAIDHLP